MGRPIKDKAGEKFGRLTVLRIAGQDERKQAIWLCRCDCGNETEVATGRLQPNRGTRSCGCSQIEARRNRPLTPLAQRFWPNVQVGRGCWEWTGTVDETVGYGRIGLGRREDGTMGAHRVAYMLAVGPIPEDAVLHHRCETPSCVRPDHLEPLTRSQHMNLHREEINK